MDSPGNAREDAPNQVKTVTEQVLSHPNGVTDRKSDVIVDNNASSKNEYATDGNSDVTNRNDYTIKFSRGATNRSDYDHGEAMDSTDGATVKTVTCHSCKHNIKRGNTPQENSSPQVSNCNGQRTCPVDQTQTNSSSNISTDLSVTSGHGNAIEKKNHDNTCDGHISAQKCTECICASTIKDTTDKCDCVTKNGIGVTECEHDAEENSSDVTDNENSITSSDEMFCDCKSIMSSQRSLKDNEKGGTTNGEEINSKKLTKSVSDSASICTYPTQSTLMDFCRICHCEGDAEIGPLIAPCYCRGSLRYVHQACLQQWIKSSDSRHCELCGYQFIMDLKLMPFRKWKKLTMSTTERRKIMFSVMFHVIAITCVIWSLYVLIERTANEIKVGKLQWPFWTKLVVVAIGFTGGLVFMYVQCKVYVQLWKRLKAHNRVIFVKSNSPDEANADTPLDDDVSVQSSNEVTSPQHRDNDAVIVEIQQNQV
ncbi:uncharacterized protein LOC120347588 [Styela clava]